jgi:alkylhydroperoxidase family enzyme
VLADYRTAPITERLRAMLGFLEKLTANPDSVGPDDARAVLAAGVSEAAFIDALNVQAMFAFITRCADAFNFDIPPDAAFAIAAKALIRFGYKL